MSASPPISPAAALDAARMIAESYADEVERRREVEAILATLIDAVRYETDGWPPSAENQAIRPGPC